MPAEAAQASEQRKGLLCCDDSGGALSIDIEETSAKLANTNKIFYNNIALALAMACWVTLFAQPIVSSHCEWVIFGNKDLCGANKMGLKAKVHGEIVNMNSTLVADGVEPYAWCGFLPGAYMSAWPGIVQTMIFTVFLSTGSTVRLAWQGLAGTSIAVANIWIMDSIFNDPGSHSGGATAPGYHWWIGWANITLVCFGFLVTKAAQNTMMYGMSYTVCFMLAFMNPATGSDMGTYETAVPYVNIDASTTVALLTSAVGCTLSIAATLMPRPLLNIKNVHSDAEEITKGIDQIFSGAIDYWKGDAIGPKRFAVYAKVGALTKAVKRVSSNLSDAYWETFDLCGFGKIRQLYTMFVDAVDRNSDEVYLLKAATGSIDFEGAGGNMHKVIVQRVAGDLEALKKHAVSCLRCCARACKDGHISMDERREISEAVKRVRQAQQDLSNQFQLATKDAEPVSHKNAADQLFIFSIAQWAQECADFADDLANFEEAYLSKHAGIPGSQFITGLGKALVDTFDPKSAFTTDQLRYVGVNLLPILLTMAVTTQASGSVFVPYSSVMPSLLALMVSSEHGIPFIKNAQSLVGIVFGHTLPLLVMSVITMMDCHAMRSVLHSLSIFVFFFMFTFMYYASAKWAGLGCSIAAFGVYTILQPCRKGFAFHFSSHYKDIAQVIIAMILKIIFQNVFQKTEPRDEALKKLKELVDTTKLAFDAFFKGDIHGAGGQPGLKALRDQVKEKLEACEAIAPATDPSLAIVPGARLPFKNRLYDAGLVQFRLVLSDLDMLVLAMTGHEEEHREGVSISAADKREDTQNEANMKVQESQLFRTIEQQSSFKRVSADLMETLSIVTGLLSVILAHDTEGPLKGDELEQLKKMNKVSHLDGVEQFCEEVSSQLKKEIAARSTQDVFKDQRMVTQLRRTRLTVALHALSLTVEHVAEISSACFENLTA